MTPRALYAPARLAGTPLLRTQSDERLVDLVRAGNDGAFEAIVARYRRGLTRYCSGILPGGRADDAVQQTFLRAYDALRASEGEMNLRPWLYRIAHNQSLNALRDRSLGHEELDESLDGVQRPDQALEGREHLNDVMAAVAALPERQRDAIVLRELEGRSYDEIAEELGVTDGAVRQLLNRARNTLRDTATSLTPVGLALRLPWDRAADSIAVRVAELCGVGGGGALAAKVCATALVTGAVVGGGVAVGPDVLPGESARGEQALRRDRGVADEIPAPAPRPAAPSASVPASGGVTRRPVEDRSGSGPSGSSGSGSGDSSGSGSSGSGSSGSGSGSSGSGSGSSGSGSDSSGSGSSGSGSGSSGSNSGSGSGSSGSGSSGSGSGSSGSGSSGSGSSGSGSDSSGSGSGSSGSSSGGDSDNSGSGSDSSGSGSSGSGSEDADLDSSGSGSSGSGSSGSG